MALRKYMLSFAAILIVLSGISGGAMAQMQTRQKLYTKSGVVLLGYGPPVKVEIYDQSGKRAWYGKVDSKVKIPCPLKEGWYQIKADDDLIVVDTDLALAKKPSTAELLKKLAKTPKVKIAGVANNVSTLQILPVPWVADSTFANAPPSFASMHVIFNKVPTRLKVVIRGGSAPYSVVWDPESDGNPQSPINAVNGYKDGAMFWTYNKSAGTPIKATVRVTDSAGNVAVGYYYMIVGNPSVAAQRVARSTDEGLWYLHTQMQRNDGYNSNGTGPFVDVGYIQTWYPISETAMYAVCLENTGHSITGGKNISNDPSKDAYVDDLNRAINFLTDSGNLIATTPSPLVKTYEGIGDCNVDTHGPNGVPNGIVLYSNGYPIYEGGMHLQAIAQAGFTDAPVPNRPEYASYYDLIGDFVDGFQYSQSPSGWSEGGWRYDFNYGDSDGSAVAWACIGLRAAEVASTLTPNPSHAPITVANYVKTALNQYWLNYDQDKGLNNVFASIDYLDDAANGHTGQYRNFHSYGGMGYTDIFWQNFGKTGGGLVALMFSGADKTDPRVKAAVGYLYRYFYTYDPSAWWSSSRDAYGMYNALKGLLEAGYSQQSITDPNGSGGKTMDGFNNIPIDWFGELVDFIAGKSDTDLGHQSWQGNVKLTSPQWSSANDGHFEPTGTRNTAIAPFNQGEWGVGSSDGNAGLYLVTAWDIAIMQSTVFTPAPVAVIAHPDTSSNEIYIPVQVNTVDYYAKFDPGNSFELNPSARIVHVRWEFGDGTSAVEYNLPVLGVVGGKVPVNTAVYPSGDTVLHHYGAVGDYDVKLTVTDDQGQSNSTTITVHAIPAPYPPVAVLAFSAVGSRQSGDIVGVLPDGSVTIQLDGSGSYNPDVTSVSTPRNANGISSFAWEWPTTPNGLSEDPMQFDEGTPTGDPNMNPGSKLATNTYTFHFDVNNLPPSILIGLRVMSNITQVNNMPPNSATIYKQINLVPNNNVPPSEIILSHLYAHNITDTTAIVSFDTYDKNGPISTKAFLYYGPTSAYGSTITDSYQGSHHDIVISGLTPLSMVHYRVNVSSIGGNISVSSSDATFQLLPVGIPILSFKVTGHSQPDANGIMTVNYQVTNSGSGSAKNLALNTFIANKGVVSANPATVTVPDVAAGGIQVFALKWNVSANKPLASFATGFKAKFQNAGGAPYSKSVMLIVVAP